MITGKRGKWQPSGAAACFPLHVLFLPISHLPPSFLPLNMACPLLLVEASKPAARTGSHISSTPVPDRPWTRADRQRQDARCKPAPADADADAASTPFPSSPAFPFSAFCFCFLLFLDPPLSSSRPHLHPPSLSALHPSPPALPASTCSVHQHERSSKRRSADAQNRASNVFHVEHSSPSGLLGRWIVSGMRPKMLAASANAIKGGYWLIGAILAAS